MIRLDETLEERFANIGLHIPEILLPKDGTDLSKWAVIACDQFTQDRVYWENVKNAVGDSPSTLNLIFPEVFLAKPQPSPKGEGSPLDEDRAERIKNIQQCMNQYLADGTFAAARRGCVYIERNTPFYNNRRGLVIAVDLEHYDWAPTARKLIRCTEGTVADRLPPRMEIRRGAALESTHILLLIDDKDELLLPRLAERAKKNAPAYQCKLQPDSGDISGWFLDAETDWEFIVGVLEIISRQAQSRYLAEGAHPNLDEAPFLFAAGDGNHSLATAKGIWEEYKKNRKDSDPMDPPCRYALVEIENIYDPAIQFEPIHRVVFGINLDRTLDLLSPLPGFSSRTISSREELVRLTAEPVQGNRFGIVAGGNFALVETTAGGISTASLQPLLDKAVSDDNSLEIDYIHGEDEVFRLASDSGKPATGILLPPVQKSGLFKTVANSGPLPRKSFSMGEGCEKRFYLECRKLS